MLRIKEIIIGVLLLVLFYAVNKCTHEKTLKESANSALNAETIYFKNKLNSLTAAINVLQVDKNTLQKSILSKDDSLKKLASEFSKIKTLVKWKTTYVHDTIIVHHDSLIPCDFVTYGGYNTDTINFNYKIDKTSLTINDLTIPNETTLITGFKRKWFLGKQTLTTDITHTNPMIKTTDIKSVEVVIPKPFYDTRLFNIGIGILTGFFIAK